MAGTSSCFQVLLGIALVSTLFCCSKATQSLAAAQHLGTSPSINAAAEVMHVQGGVLQSTPPVHPISQHMQAKQQQHTVTAESAADDAAAAQRVLLQEAGTNIQLRPTPEEPVPQAVSKQQQQQQHTALPSKAAAIAAAWKAQQQQRRQQVQQAQPIVSKGFLNHDTHKHLLPIDYKDICLFILSFCVLSLAAGAGIGGGVLLVPMLSLITGFNSIETVALSNITIFSGAIANMIFNLPRKHPFKPGPIIDYDLLLLFGPPIVMGSIAGSYINYFVPGWVTKTLVLLVLSPMTWRMISKARMLWVAENRRGSVVEHSSKSSTMPWTNSSVLGGSLELVTSMPEAVPEDKELPPVDADQGRISLLQPAPTISTEAEAIGRHQHQLHLTPLATAASAQHASARHSGLWGPYRSSAAGGSPPSGLVNSSSSSSSSLRWPLARRSTHDAWAHQGERHSHGLSHTHGSGGHHNMLASHSSLGRTHSHASMLAALSERPPSLADLLGPYFVVLTTPQVADATLEVQAQAQALIRHPPLPAACSVTRRHTLDASQASPCCIKHSCSCSSRPSSAPTLPSDWDSSQGESFSMSASVSAPYSPGVADSSSSSVNPLAIISPFQLYQQQRCQQAHKQDGKAPHWCEGLLSVEQEHKLQEPCCPELPCAAKAHCRQLMHTCCTHTPELDAKMRQYIHKHQTAQLPKAHLAALLLMLSAVIITSVTATLLLTCGTWQYWCVVLMPLPLMTLVWVVMRWHVMWRVGWQNFLDLTHPTDIAWTPSTTLIFPAIVITVGVMAGMLGLGGGIVLAPLLLELGVQPAVSAASSQSAMLMSSCTSTVVYLVNQAMPKDYGIAMAVIGFCGTLFGQVAFNYAVQRTGRSSILVFILAALFVLATGAGIIVVSNAITAIVHTPAKLTMTHACDICTMKGS